jgi:DNA-binding NtrC family response regulator
MSALVNYRWPGNVRELENAIERALILCSDVITIDCLPPKVQASANGRTSNVQPTLEDVERQYIFDVLRSAGDDKVRAASILGIDLSTLYRKLKRYDEV